MESYKLVIHIRYFEFEDGAFVACGQSRTRDVPLLFSGNKDRKHTCIRWELGVHPIVETRRNVQDGYVHAGVFGLGAAQEQLTKITAKWLEPAPASVK